MAPGDFHSTEKIGSVTIVEWEEHGHVGGSEAGAAYKRVNDAPKSVVVDEADANTTYIGESYEGAVKSQAVWQIKKISVSGAITQILYADGNSRYDNVWDDRLSLSYS